MARELAIPTSVVEMMRVCDGGPAWLEALPDLVAAACERWQLTLGPPYPGGCVAYVAPADRRDGTRAVLKVTFVDEETRAEADALRLWDGDGAARLLDADAALGALLLERLEPGTPLLAEPDREAALATGCRLLRRLWRPLPPGQAFPLVSELVARLADDFPVEQERLGRPLPPMLVDAASALARDFAAGDGRVVVANRDFHLGNVLAAAREPWLAIDPKPLAGEPAFDTGHLVRDALSRETLDRASARRIVDRVAGELDVDRARVRAWALVRAVDDALWNLGRLSEDAAWDAACARVLFELDP
jgi:streptomycin 6-kinase